MGHKRLEKKILLLILCIAIALGNITIAHAGQDTLSADPVNRQTEEAAPLKDREQTGQAEEDGTRTVIINGEEVPLSEGENITKNDNTGLIYVGLFAGILVLAGAREYVVRKRSK